MLGAVLGSTAAAHVARPHTLPSPYLSQPYLVVLLPSHVVAEPKARP
jgi:hypothetical protein